MQLTRLTRYDSRLTRADLWKSFALLLMLIDHIGWLFFPDDLIWRAIGRASMPIWCFFIGYHCVTREGTPLKSDLKSMQPLFIGAAILTATNWATGYSEFLFLPLPILVTFLIIKLLLKQPLIRRSMVEYPYEWLIAMGFLAIPTTYLFEYGTPALLFASAGYFIKRGWLEAQHPYYQTLRNVTLLSCALYLALQWGNYEFSVPLALLMTSICLPIFYGLSRYVPGAASLSLPSRTETLFKLGGRYTLEFYVVHKVLLQLLSMV